MGVAGAAGYLCNVIPTGRSGGKDAKVAMFAYHCVGRPREHILAISRRAIFRLSHAMQLFPYLLGVQHGQTSPRGPSHCRSWGRFLSRDELGFDDRVSSSRGFTLGSLLIPSSHGLM